MTGRSSGFPNWTNLFWPCFKCIAMSADMYKTASVNPLGLPWRINEDADYQTARSRCEVRVTFPTAALRDEVTPLPWYDKRANGVFGRGLSQLLPHLGLVGQCRLEQSDELPDVGLFEHVTSLPFTATFWRCDLRTVAKHRCPLFVAEVGLMPRLISVDTFIPFTRGCSRTSARISSGRFYKPTPGA